MKPIVSFFARALFGLAAVLLGLAFPPAASGRDDGSALIPAGSMNSVFSHPAIVVIYEDEPIVQRHATQIAKQFFPRAEVITADDAEETDLTGKNLIIYGSADCAWIQRLSPRLPFRFGDDRVALQAKEFEGEHLRVLCAIRNPQDASRSAVLYAAAHAADIAGINNIHHGATEWLVADGARTLAAGSFDVEHAAAQLSQDLDYLVEKIEAVHVAAIDGLPDRVRNAVDHARDAITGPMSHDEFAFLVGDVLIALHDAHSSVESGGSGSAVELPVRWIDEGLIVTDATKVLNAGDRIDSLGQLSTDDLLDGLKRLVPAENEWWVRYRGARMLADAAVLARLGADMDPLTARVERDGEMLDVVVPRGLPQRAEDLAAPWVRYKIDAVASLGIFTLDQCRVDDEYRRRLHEFFEAVHDNEIARVAVDLRRNSGGDSKVTDEFIRYLDVDEYRSFHGVLRISPDAIEQRHYPPPPRVIVDEPRVNQNDRIDDLPPFRGELYVLTSNQTFSSANWFAAVIQDNDLGKLVGEPTGNAPSVYGDLLKFTLPQSGIAFSLSHKRFVRPAPERDPASTLTPDVPIPLTRRDIVEGTDPVILYLRALKD